jgi:pimeloyl-ACP methyl ester carboxylesterase
LAELARSWRARLAAALSPRSLVFRPSPARRELTPADLRIPYADVSLDCPRGVKVHGWWIGGERARAVIYFHGSDGSLAHELPAVRFLHGLGASLLLIDYPGYGRSGGRCGERQSYQAAEAAWAYARDERGFRAEDVVLFGHSLGGAVATYLAAGRPCGGLVLQSGFTSVPDMAALVFPHLPVGILCHIRMNSLRRVARCRCPVLVLHGERDEHIPVAQARRIYERAPGPKRFVGLPGSHRSTAWRRDPDVLAAWEELLAGRTERWERSA